MYSVNTAAFENADPSHIDPDTSFITMTILLAAYYPSQSFAVVTTVLFILYSVECY